MSLIYKGIGIVVGLLTVGWMYLGYWLLSAILQLPAWIALRIGAPVLALQAITVILFAGYIIFWLIAAGCIFFVALSIFFGD